MGTVFQVPWAYLGSEAAQWPQPGIRRLRQMGFRTAAMALDERAVPVDDPRLAAEEKLAVILGTEGDGLAARTIADSVSYTHLTPSASSTSAWPSTARPSPSPCASSPLWRR